MNRRSVDFKGKNPFYNQQETATLKAENEKLKAEVERLREALRRIVDERDYTAPEKATQIARKALAPQPNK